MLLYFLLLSMMQQAIWCTWALEGHFYSFQQGALQLLKRLVPSLEILGQGMCLWWCSTKFKIVLNWCRELSNCVARWWKRSTWMQKEDHFMYQIKKSPQLSFSLSKHSPVYLERLWLCMGFQVARWTLESFIPSESKTRAVQPFPSTGIVDNQLQNRG